MPDIGQPRAFIASIEKRENSRFPASDRQTWDIRSVRSDQFIRIFEASIDGADYFLTYVPPGSECSTYQADECKLQVDVRSDAFQSICPDATNDDPIVAVIKLKDGCAAQLEHWAAQLALLNLEAKESIRRERVIFETWFSFTLGRSVYLFAYMQPSHFLPKSKDGLSQLEVDVIHAEFKLTWDKTIKIPVRLLA